MGTGRSLFLGERFRDALGFAVELHASQYRKGTTVPYVSHLLAVASLVIEEGGDEDEAIAALLHDAIEDQGPPDPDRLRRKIRARFGEAVLTIVNACTDAETYPKPPWRERKERYVEHLRSAGASVRRVAAADKLHNARAILCDYRQHGPALWSRFNGGRDGTLWYYAEVVSILERSPTGHLASELRRVVDELTTLVSAEDSRGCERPVGP